MHEHLMKITDIVPQKTWTNIPHLRCNNAVKAAYNNCNRAWTIAEKCPTAANYNIANAASRDLASKM